MRWTLSAVLLSVSMFSACDRSPSSPPIPQAVRTDSAGITIVSNAGPDRPLAWALEEEFRIGGADEGPESFFQIDDDRIAVGPGGDIYVLDGGNRRVLRFDSLGNALGIVARAGEGPEELRRPQALVVDLGARVTILDLPRLGVVTFTNEGEYVGETELRIPTGAIAFLNGGLVHAAQSGFRREGGTVRHGLTWLSPDGTEVSLATIERPRPELVRYPNCVGLMLEPLFSPGIVWSSNGSRLAVNAGDAYNISVHDGSGSHVQVRRELTPRPVTEEIALREIGQAITVRTPNFSCKIEAQALLEGRGFHDFLPAIGDIAVDPDGRLWIARGRFDGEPSLVDIIESDGTYLGTIEGLEVFPAAFLSSELLLARTTDDLDIEYVTVFRLQSE